MKKAAPLFIILAGIQWGTMGIFVRKLEAYGLETMDIVSVRAMITTLMMSAFLLCYDRKLFKIRRKDLWCFLGTGLCSIVFFNYCYFKAITMTSLSVASVLLYTAPMIVMAFSAVLFGEKLTGKKMIAAVLSFTGCIFVTGILQHSVTVSFAGFLTGLGAGLGYALYSIFGRYAIRKNYHSLTIITYTFLFAGIGTIPFVMGGTMKRNIQWNGSLLLFGILLSLIATVLPFLLYTVGLTYMESSKASIMASIEPVVATLIGIMIYQEKATVLGITGVILIIFSIAVLNWKDGRL